MEFSPIKLITLIQCYYIRDRDPEVIMDSPAKRDAVASLVGIGLVQMQGFDNGPQVPITTERGDRIARLLIDIAGCMR